MMCENTREMKGVCCFVVSAALDKKRVDPYTSFREIAKAISMFCIKHYCTLRHGDIAWKVVTQNLKKGNGRHGYTNQLA
jgi:hypothetical protein